MKKKDDKEIITNYIKDMIKNYIDNIDNSYLKFLVYKYKNKIVDSPEYNIDINININNDKGGDIFE